MPFLVLAGVVALGIFGYSRAPENVKCRVTFSCESNLSTNSSSGSDSSLERRDRRNDRRSNSRNNRRTRESRDRQVRPAQQNSRSSLALKQTSARFIRSNSTYDLIGLLEELGEYHGVNIIIDEVQNESRVSRTNPLGLYQDEEDFDDEKLSFKLLNFRRGSRDIIAFRDFVTSIIEEFYKYPSGFFQEANIVDLVFVKDVYYDRARRNSFPDYQKNGHRLIFDIIGERHPAESPFAYEPQKIAYVSHTFHHELFHMIDMEFNRDFVRQRRWTTVHDNHDHLNYEEAGYASRINIQWFPFEVSSIRNVGFISNYSRINAREDRAEIYMYYVMENFGRSQRFRSLMQRDPVIREKVDRIVRFMNRHIPSWNDRAR